MFSKKLEYGYLILKALKKTNEENLKTGQEILEKIDIPYNMGLTILSELSSSGLIKSVKGKKGGFYCHKKEMTFLDLFQSLESRKKFTNTLNANNEYDSKIFKIGIAVIEEMRKIKI